MANVRLNSVCTIGADRTGTKVSDFVAVDSVKMCSSWPTVDVGHRVAGK